MGYEGFSFANPFENKSEAHEGAVKLSLCGFDGMKNADGPKVQNYGQVSSLELPNGFREKPVLYNDGPKVFETRDRSQRIGVYEEALSNRYDSKDGNSVLSQPPHKLNDDEYFKIVGMMSPGPWSTDGRNHELGLQTQEINGKKAVVYDFWHAKDVSQDSPTAQPGPDDTRSRVYFVPNDKTGKVDVMWFQAKNADFDQASKSFDDSLKSIKWR